MTPTDYKSQTRSDLFVMPALAPLSCPPAPSGIPAGPLCHARRPPLALPPVPLCHSRQPPLSFPSAPSVIPVGPPLSFPPVFSGNPVSFSSVPVIRVALHGKRHGFPIKNVGNDIGGIVWPRMRAALDSASLLACPLWLLVMPALAPLSCPPAPFCHARRFLAGIQCFSLLSLHSGGPAWEKPWIPD